MGNAPSEANGVRCNKCGRNLPPCKSFDNFTKKTLDDRYVYVYNGGQYYRQVGWDNAYECPDCFWKPKRDREERARREEEARKRREEEARKRREEEARKAKEEQMKEELRNSLEANYQDTKKSLEEERAEHEKQQTNETASEYFKKSHDEFEEVVVPSEKGEELNEEEFLALLSVKCNVPIPTLELGRLSSAQVTGILQALRQLLYEDWVKQTPSQGTLDHVQVFMTELFSVSAEATQDPIVRADDLDDLIQTISSSGRDNRERLLLTQAIFQMCLNSFDKNLTSALADLKALAIAKKWVKEEFTPEQIFLLNVLETILTYSRNTNKTDSARSVTNIEKSCYELLIKRAMYYSDSKCDSDIIEKMLQLVQTSLWSPIDALDLLHSVTMSFSDDGALLEFLHLVETYRLNSHWQDKEGRTLRQALEHFAPKDLLSHLENVIKLGDVKNLDVLIEEIRAEGRIADSTLKTVHDIIMGVNDELKRKGDIVKNFRFNEYKKGVFKMQGNAPKDLQKMLEILCIAVVQTMGWYPRVAQMVSWCFLALAEGGQLLEIGTGEGKSCVIAMFAAMRVLRGQQVDIVTSSPVLAQRDAEEWKSFYMLFNITVDTNPDKIKDEDRYGCYLADVVYGTVETFSADFLRQSFELKNIRPKRAFDCIIVDEVDFLLLDRGVQFTYLSTDMVSMQHLNPVLATIWGSVSQFAPVAIQNEIILRGPPLPFFRALYGMIHGEEFKVEDPMQLLKLAEETHAVTAGFTEKYASSNQEQVKELLTSVDQSSMLTYFSKAEEYFPYRFIVYTQDEQGILQTQDDLASIEEGTPVVSFLVLDHGICCILYSSEEGLSSAITELVRDKLQFTPTESEALDRLNIPGFLKSLIENKLETWVKNAFLATKLQEQREYLVEDKSILPIDFKSTGVVELNKKWGDGLQQFLEMKHLCKLSTMSSITNFISNVSFFRKYNGQIYGTTGTLGTDSDIDFLFKLYPSLSVCRIPTFNQKKLFEVKGVIESTQEKWRDSICLAVKRQVCSASYRKGRASLVICEDMNRAKEIYKAMQGQVPGQVKLYIRNDIEEVDVTKCRLNCGDVIVATNLAGRGTNIKVTDEVNKSGGLFVVLSFLAQNRRVELQAFGRTARKGLPGSAQIICDFSSLNPELRKASYIGQLKVRRDVLATEKIKWIMVDDIPEVLLKEKLFAEYCKILSTVYQEIEDEEDEKIAVSVLNEYWGTWLQTKSLDIIQLNEMELLSSLKKDIGNAKSKSKTNESPLSSIYHYIRFGNNLLFDGKVNESARLFSKAITFDKSWATIAYYNHAYCTIKQSKQSYMVDAISDLEKAQGSLKNLKEMCLVTAQLVLTAKNRSTSKEGKNQFSINIDSRCQVLNFFEKNIQESIAKLKEIKRKNRDAEAVESGVFSLGLNAGPEIHEELYEFYKLGLINVFSIKEKPRFCWEGLVVFLLGAVQVIAGALLVALTSGALANIGMGLIAEGISDCIEGTVAMATGEFSWESWATNKAISICVSLIGFGVGKLMSKGYKYCNTAIKTFGKQLKGLPKVLAKEAQGGLTKVMKQNMKEALKYAGKDMAEKAVMYGVSKAEDEILNLIIKGVEDEVKKSLIIQVKKHVHEDPLGMLIDCYVLAQFQEQTQTKYLLSDNDISAPVKKTFNEFLGNVLQPYVVGLEWQNQLSSSILKVIESAEEDVKGVKKTILTSIKATQMSVLCADAIASIAILLKELNTKLCEALKKEMTKKKIQFDNAPYQTADAKNNLKKFKDSLADYLSTELSKNVVNIFHQKFSSHLVDKVKGKLDDYITGKVKGTLKTEETMEKLNSAKKSIETVSISQSKESNEPIKNYRKKVKNPDNPGSLLDLKVLSEATGTKIIILHETEKGKLKRKSLLEPSKSSVSTSVQLLYRPASKDYPDGHYNIVISGKIIIMDSKKKTNVYYVLAKGLEPAGSEAQVEDKATELRSLEVTKLKNESSSWKGLVLRKTWVVTIRGGGLFTAVDGKPILNEERRSAIIVALQKGREEIKA
ncbi:uncharacterized protein LOC135359053 [Latimeria chalumnae]|uniref:uncharacterized protein LOC135359053 n=1 Tax=Latimeria chalumnae TaxID=7897 RepID=UPI00313D4DDA